MQWKRWEALTAQKRFKLQDEAINQKTIPQTIKDTFMYFDACRLKKKKKHVTALILLIGDFSQNIMKLMSLSTAQSVIWYSQIR